MKEGGIISQENIDKMVKQALFNLLKSSKELIPYGDVYSIVIV